MVFFTYDEFESPDLKGSGEMMDSTLLFKLENAREMAGVPFKINSGYRTEAHNKSINARSTSSHIKGLAVDIHCTKGIYRQKILTALIKAGFTRIGIANTFIHVDTDREKLNSIWVY